MPSQHLGAPLNLPPSPPPEEMVVWGGNLRRSPYPNGCARAVGVISWTLLRATFWTIDHLVSLFVSYDRHHHHHHHHQQQQQQRHKMGWTISSMLVSVLRFFLYVIILIILLPFTLLALPLWLAASARARPFTYAIYGQRVSVPLHKADFQIVSANLGLWAESAARKHKLRSTEERAREIAAKIMAAHTAHRGEVGTDSILANFPVQCDFLLLQGVFDPGADATLLHRLHMEYSYCIHRVGVQTWRALGPGAGSGLVLFSKYRKKNVIDSVRACVCVLLCVHVCTCVCSCVFIYMYVYIYMCV